MGKTMDTKEFSGHSWRVSQLPARRAVAMFTRLGRALGPAAFQALATGGKSLASHGLDEDVDLVGAVLPALSPALATLFDRLKDDELNEIADVLLETALCDGVPVLKQYDALFQGQVLMLLRVLAFAIEVNYSDFFDAGRAALSQRKAGAETSKAGSPT